MEIKASVIGTDLTQIANNFYDSDIHLGLKWSVVTMSTANEIHADSKPVFVTLCHLQTGSIDSLISGKQHPD